MKPWIYLFTLSAISTLCLSRSLQSYHSISKVCTYMMLPTLQLIDHSLSLGSSSGKLIGLICRRFASLLQEFEKFQTVVREAGFLNVLSIMLSDMTDTLTNRNNDESQQPFTQQVLENFDAIADCIVEMIKNPANMALFQKT